SISISEIISNISYIIQICFSKLNFCSLKMCFFEYLKFLTKTNDKIKILLIKKIIGTFN
ncbi:hypothetical protein LCGC14_2325390, partial [marine sediment metagenome]